MNTSTLDFLNNLALPQRQVVDLPINLIDPDPDQPRTTFNTVDGMVDPEEEEALKELSDDIAEHTLLQPILVKELDNGRYQIIAGERRWRATKLNNARGLQNSNMIQAIIRQDLSDAKLRLTQLSENIQRRDLTEIEVATFLKAVLEEFPELQKKNLAELLKRNSQYISRILALVDPRWSDVVQTGIISYASLLEQYRSLPEHKQHELKRRAVEEGRSLTSGDMKRARVEHKNTDATVEHLSARDFRTTDFVSGQIDAEGGQKAGGLDPEFARSVQSLIDEQAPKGENYRPSGAVLTPIIEESTRIVDYGGNAVIPQGVASLNPSLLEKREVKLTASQLITLYRETKVSDSYVVSMMLPVKELRLAIQELNGEEPEDDNLLVMTLVQLLNQRVK